MSYEIADAYVAIKPSLTGISSQLNKEMTKTIPAISNSIRGGLSKGISGSSSALTSSLGGFRAAGAKAGGVFGRAAAGSIRASANTLGRTLSNALKVAAGTAFASVATVGSQAIVGGANREIQTNDARARLEAMGKDAKEVASVMQSATDAITGTQYAMGEASKVAGQLLAAGSGTGQELTDNLKQIVKLSDMSGRSFEEMGSIFSKNMTSGLLYAEDLNQLNDSGIAIYGELAKVMEVSASEVKKLASEGKVSFEDAQRAFNNIEWDSAIYASKSISGSFKNLRAQISIIGGKFLSPLLAGSAKVFNTLGQGLKSLQRNKGFQNFLARSNALLEDFVDKTQGFADAFKSALDSKAVDKFFSNFVLKMEKIRQFLSGKEFIAAGLGAGFFGSLLSGLPVVGKLFAGVNPLVGVFLGFIAQAEKDSSVFSEALKGLAGYASEFIKGLTGSIGAEDIFSAAGAKLEGFKGAFVKLVSQLPGYLSKIDFKELGGKLGDNIKGLVVEIKKHIPPIVDAVKSVFSSLGEALKGLSGSGDISIGEAIGKVLGGGLEIALKTLAAVAPLAATVAGIIGKVVTSDFAKGIFGALLNFAGWLGEHEGVLKAGLAVGAGLFAAGKLGKLMGDIGGFTKLWSKTASGATRATTSASRGGGLGGFFKSVGETLGGLVGSIAPIVDGLKPVIRSISGVLVSVAKGLGAIGASVVGAMATIGQAAASGAPYVAAFGLLVTGIGAVIYALDKLNVFEVIGNIAKGVHELITSTLREVFEVAGEMLDSFSNAIVKMVGIFATSVPLVINALGQLSKDIASSFVTTFAALGGFMAQLSTSGAAAGEGATKLAAGTIKLAGAMSALLVATSAGAIVNGAIGALTGESGGLTQINDFVASIGRIGDEVTLLPQIMGSVAGNASMAGANVGSAYTGSLIGSLQAARASISSEVNSLMNSLQADINARPLKVRVVSNTSNVGAGSSRGVNNTYNNVSVNLRNSASLDGLMRRGGYLR